jgi:hypothetical protein
MKTTPFLPMSNAIKVLTILVILLLAYMVYFLLYQQSSLEEPNTIFILVVLALSMLAAVIMIPHKVEVTEDAINIRLLGWKIHVPKDEVVSIEHYSRGITSHRIVGMGMFFGNVGLFTCSQCGKHFAAITDPSDVCIITRKTKRPIVVSVKDYHVFQGIAPVEEK